jgi:hypothetical protein
MQNNLCETREGVKSYSGYVRMPPGTADLAQGQDYPINTVSQKPLNNVIVTVVLTDSIGLLVLRGEE